jgi:uncharacterized phiE125 gp8 family phage protein
MATDLVTAPAIEPLTIDEVKDHLRVESSDYDNEIKSLIKEARQYVERITGRSLITQTWDYKLDKFSESIKIPYPPLQSVTSVKYQDSGNVEQTLSSAYYDVDTTSEPGRVTESYNYEYPETYDEPNAVTIRFVSGYGSARTDIPERFKRAMKLYVQWQFDGNDTPTDALNHLILQDRVGSVGS